MELNPDLSQHNLEAFSQNLKNLEQVFHEGDAINTELPYLRIDGLEGILNHGIFGHSEQPLDEPQPILDGSAEEMMTTASFSQEKSLHSEKPKKKRVYPTNLEKNLKCGHCNFVTHNKYNLENHLLRHADPSNTKVYTCPECPYSSVIKRNVDRHAKKHKTGFSLKCKECSFETVQCHEFKRHLHTHFQVDIRPEVLIKNEMQGINIIKKDPSGALETVFQCDQCMYTCNNIRYLKKHKINIHQTARAYYKCDLCDFQTPHRRYLNKHNQHMHTAEEDLKLHACSKCPFTSKYRACVMKHQKVHLGEEGKAMVYYCYNCSFQTIHKGSLIKHIPLHRELPLDDKPLLKCDVCPYETKRKDVLTRHRTVHQDSTKLYRPRNYQCKKCGVQYKSRKEWFKHVYNDCKYTKEKKKKSTKKKSSRGKQIKKVIKIKQEASNDGGSSVSNSEKILS